MGGGVGGCKCVVRKLTSGKAGSSVYKELLDQLVGVPDDIFVHAILEISWTLSSMHPSLFIVNNSKTASSLATTMRWHEGGEPHTAREPQEKETI